MLKNFIWITYTFMHILMAVVVPASNQTFAFLSSGIVVKQQRGTGKPEFIRPNILSQPLHPLTVMLAKKNKESGEQALKSTDVISFNDSKCGFT